MQFVHFEQSPAPDGMEMSEMEVGKIFNNSTLNVVLFVSVSVFLSNIFNWCWEKKRKRNWINKYMNKKRKKSNEKKQWKKVKEKRQNFRKKNKMALLSGI